MRKIRFCVPKHVHPHFGFTKKARIALRHPLAKFLFVSRFLDILVFHCTDPLKALSFILHFSCTLLLPIMQSDRHQEQSVEVELQGKGWAVEAPSLQSRYGLRHLRALLYLWALCGSGGFLCSWRLSITWTVWNGQKESRNRVPDKYYWLFLIHWFLFIYGKSLLLKSMLISADFHFFKNWRCVTCQGQLGQFKGQVWWDSNRRPQDVRQCIATARAARWGKIQHRLHFCHL